MKFNKTQIITKLTAILLFFLTWAIYWTPDKLLLTFPGFYPILETLSLGIVIFIAYKAKVFVNFKSTFRPLNLLWLFGLIIVAFLFDHYDYKFYVDFVPALDAVIGNQQNNNFIYSFVPDWFAFLMSVIFSPIFEELIFREYLYRFFEHKWLAFIVSVLLFTWLHTGLTWAFFLYLPGDIIITRAYHRRKCVTDSIIVHAGSNFLPIIVPLILSAMIH